MHISAIVQAKKSLFCNSNNNKLFVINLAKVPGRRNSKTPPAQSRKTLAAILLRHSDNNYSMTNILKSLIPLLTLLVFVSCSNSDKKSEKSDFQIRWDKQEKLDTLNFNEAQKLSNLSNAIMGWDTTENFTYSLQELLNGEAKPISFIGAIKDIVKTDNTYLLKVVNTNSKSSKNYIAEISVTANIFQSLKLKLDPKETNEGCFIFQVTKVSSHLPILSSEIESDGENVEDASSYLTLDFNERLVKLQGKLITYFLYDRLKEDNE